METVKLTFKYTQSEYIKAFRQYLILSKIITKTSIIIFILLSLFSVSYAFNSSYSLFSVAFLALVTIIDGMHIFAYFVTPHLVYKQGSKYQEEYNLIFTKDYIKFLTLSINSELKWSNYIEAFESKKFYFLIQGKRRFTIIPKRAFINELEKEAFENLVKSNLKYVK